MTTTTAEQHPPPQWWILVRHEWRLAIRESFAGRSKKKREDAQRVGKPRSRTFQITAVVLLLVVFHLCGLGTLLLPRTWIDNAVSRMVSVGLLAFLCTLMLSYTMTRTVVAFHERRDLDLLLSSPVSPTLLLGIRASTVAASTWAMFAFFVYPFVDVGVVTGHAWMARVYALIPLVALLVTAIALVLTDLLVRAVGVRRARIGLQILSAVIGASIYLITQARQFLPAEVASGFASWLRSVIRVDDAPWPVEFIAALARGDLAAWLALVVASIGLFGAGVVRAQGRFVAIAQTPEADSRVTRATPSVASRSITGAFARGAFMTFLLKEWRLILRAPQLVSQVLLQALYLMPLVFVALSRHGEMAGYRVTALVAGVVGLSAALAGSLAWLTVSGEDAPDLLAGSPRPQGVIIGAKVTAALIPPLAVVALVAIAFFRQAPGIAFIVLTYGVLACLSATILAVASPSPGRRSDFQRRNRGRAGHAMLEVLQFALWLGASAAATTPYPYVALALTVLASIAPAIRFPRALESLRGP